MSVATACTNHTCAKAIDTQNDNHVMCSLCRDAIYCSEECRMIDWPAHACPNVVQRSIDTLIATPYYYQDEMPAAELEQMIADEANPLNESFLLHQVGTDMKVAQLTLPVIGESAAVTRNPLTSFGKGSKPTDQMMNKTMRVQLFQGNAQGRLIWDSGEQGVGDRAIYKGSDNETANAIANLWTVSEAKSNSLLVWPFVDGQPKMDTRGDVYALITISGYKPLELTFFYPTIRTNWITRASAQAGKYLRRRMLTKFPGQADKLKFFQTMRAMSADGVGLYLTFSLQSNTQTKLDLKDVEVLVPLDRLEPTTEMTQSQKIVQTLKNVKLEPDSVESIYCDATKLEHMVGLTMACEYAATQIKAEMISAPSNLAAFEEAAAIVRKYTREFAAREAGSEFEATPMHVNAAVYTAMNALQEMQQIEISISKDNVKKYTDKLTRAGRPAQAEALAIQEITPIVNELEKIRTEAAAKKGNWFKKKFASAKKSRLDKQLDEWKIAIENYLNAQPPETKFAQADALIRKGKSPLAAAAEM